MTLQANINDNSAHAAPLLFRPGEENSCPDCGAAHRLIGRAMAECGACRSALPLTQVKLHVAATLHTSKNWPPRPMPRAA